MALTEMALETEQRLGLGFMGQMSRLGVVVACVGDVEEWSGREVDCHGMKISLSSLRICHAHNFFCV